MSLRTRARCLILSALALALCEGLFQVAERSGLIRLRLLREKFYEDFYFSYLTSPPRALPTSFDRLLGWRNASGGRINREGWRSPSEFAVPSQGRQRIAVLGDSFAFGMGVKDGETLPAVLGRELGEGYEVMNFAVRGFGLDQMALASTEVVASYRPDLVVLAIIGEDLERACMPFLFNMRKPQYLFKDGRWRRGGIPVATPYETFLEHQGRPFWDAAARWITRSALVNGIGECLLYPQRKRCVEDLSLALLEEVQTKFPGRVLLFHLEGKLPEAFTQALVAKGYPFLSMGERPFQEAKYRTADGHPSALLQAIYAQALVPRVQAHFSPPREEVVRRPKPRTENGGSAARRSAAKRSVGKIRVRPLRSVPL